MIKKTTILRFVLIASISFISLSVFTYTNTPPANQAGNPGAANCTSCHAGTAVTNGANWNAIALTGLPSGGYAPSTTYSITVNGNSASTSKNGFQITCLTTSNAMAGSFASGTGSTIVSGNGNSYVTQSGGTSGTWTFNWTAPSTAVGTVTFYLSFNGSNANSNTSGDIIYTKTFTLNQAAINLPSAVITPNNTTICLGDTLFLAGSGINNPTTFNWQFLNHTPNSATGQNTFVVYNSIGSKTVRLTTSNSNGNSPVAGVNINVVAKPNANILTPNGTTICGNDSLTIQTNVTNGFSYLWTPGNLTTSSIKVLDSVNYRLRVTNTANGCFANSSFFKPTKAAYPQSTLVANKDTICKNDSVLFSLTGTGFTANYFVNDTLDYQGLIFNFKRNFAGVYNINARVFQNGCTAITPNKSIAVQEQALAPTIVCGSSTSASMQFTWNQVSNFTSYEISTNNGADWIQANGNNQLSHTLTGLQPNSNQTILARVKSNGPCGNGLISNKTCINNGCSSINALYAYKRFECVNAIIGKSATTFEVKNITNPKYLVQFETDSALSTFSRNTSFTFFAKVGINNIRIKIKDSIEANCPIIDSIFKIVGNLSPIAPVLSTNKPNNTFCKNDDIFLTATKGNNSNLFSFYQTNPTKKLIEATLSNTINLKNKLLGISNNIKAIVIDTATFCADSSLEINITENIKPVANFSFEYFKSDSNNVNKNRVVFTNLSSDSTTQKWYFGDMNNSTSITKNAEFIYNKGGSYNASLVATYANNCSDSTSKSISISNTSMLGLSKNIGIKVFPNPAKEVLYMEFNEDFKINKLYLIDVNGKEILATNLDENRSINIHNLVKGIYLIKFITDDEKTFYTKFIKE